MAQSKSTTVYEIILKDNFSKAMGKVIAATKKFDDEFKAATSNVKASQEKIKDGFDKIKHKSNQTTKKVKSNNSSLAGSFNSIRTAISGAAVAFGAYQLAQFGKDVVNLQADFEGFRNTLKASSSTEQEFAKNQKFLTHIINDLGLGMTGTTKAFAKFSGSVKGSILEGEEARKLFLGVSQAGTVMGLSQEQMNDSFRALSQMASKGKVSSEELTQQLGDHLPNALGHAADAMGKTKGELLKMMKDGKLMADEFLPRFSAHLIKTFSKDSKKASNSLRANMNRINNSFINFRLLIGESMGEAGKGFIIFFKELKSFVSENKQTLQNFFHTLAVGFRNMFSLMAIGIKWIRENKEQLKAFANGIIFATSVFVPIIAAIKAYQLVLKGVAAIQALVAATNPFLLVAAGIAALGAIFVSFWNTSEKFRGAVIGIWQAFKQIGNSILELNKKRLMPFINSIKKLVSGDFKGAFQSASEGIKGVLLSPFTVVDDVKNIGKEIGEAYTNGVKKGANAGKINLMPSLKKFTPNLGGETNGTKSTGSSPTTPTGTTPTASGESLGATTSGASTSKSTNINIDVSKIVETLNVNSTNLTESTAVIEEKITMALLKVLNNANNLANG